MLEPLSLTTLNPSSKWQIANDQSLITNGFRAPTEREVQPAYAVSFTMTTSVILSPVRMALTTAMS
jgi:hypothetical protein